MAKVGILMGSDSDLEVMKAAAQILESFGIGANNAKKVFNISEKRVLQKI